MSEGRTNQDSPETFGATNLINSNANQLLRDVGACFDIHITEPFFHQLYEWLLLDEDVPDALKEEFRIDAKGSVAMIERAIADQAISQMETIVVDPKFGADPRKWFRTMLRTKRIHPEEIMMSDQEFARQAAMPPPKPPQVQVAEIKAGVDLKELAAKQSTEDRSLQNEQSIAAAAAELDKGRIAAEDRRTQVEATVDLHALRQKHHHELLKYANQNKMKIADINKELLMEAMRQEGQRDVGANVG